MVICTGYITSNFKMHRIIMYLINQKNWINFIQKITKDNMKIILHF